MTDDAVYLDISEWYALESAATYYAIARDEKAIFSLSDARTIDI